MKKTVPILEFDEDRSSILNPDPYRFTGTTQVPSLGVLCFFQDVLASLVETGELKEFGALNSEMGRHPVYCYEQGGRPVTVFHPELAPRSPQGS